MNREKAQKLISSLLCGTHKESSNNHYRDVALGVDKIYDSFEKKNTIDVNIKITDLELFTDLTNLLKENIDSLPTELKDKLSEILEK